MPTALITGASQGLGLEFVRQYAGAGWSLIACCRNPSNANGLKTLSKASPRIRIEALDVTDGAAIKALARTLQRQPIDLLINNAGMIGPAPLTENLPRQLFGGMDYALWEEVLHTNTFGPLRMTEAFAEHVAASGQKKIICLSSTVGSIAEGRRRALAYATSKAALNKAMTIVAEELRPRGIIVSLLCPGYVKTRMNMGGATVESTDSVAGMCALIEGFTLADSGTFRRYNGETIAW